MERNHGSSLAERTSAAPARERREVRNPEPGLADGMNPRHLETATMSPLIRAHAGTHAGSNPRASGCSFPRVDDDASGDRCRCSP